MAHCDAASIIPNVIPIANVKYKSGDIIQKS